MQLKFGKIDMLIEFSVKNYRSFKEQQRFSLVAAAGAELQEENTFQVEREAHHKFLKSAVIYGANAAGKSNLIAAMEFMQRFVKESLQEKEIRKNLNCTPFLLDSHTKDMPSEFEMIFMIQGIRFQYGFAITPTRVVKEWLIAYPEKRAQTWFEREYNKKTKKEEWKIGSKLLGGRQIDLWKKSTRPDTLFISTAHQFNNQQFHPIYTWFSEKLVILKNKPTSDFSKKECEEEDKKKNILNFMNTLDLKINDIRMDPDIIAFLDTEKSAGIKIELLDKNLSKKDFNKEIEKLIPQEWKKKSENIKKFFLKNLTFIHLNEKNEEVAFTPQMESDGTLNIFNLSPYFLTSLTEEKVLVIDEIDNSLHSALVRGLIKYFQNSENKKSNAQLVCTTHDISLLDPTLLRRDQIWFVEKKQDNSTDLYSLADFSPRKNEAFGKGYLAGRYGAIPFVGEWRFDDQ